ncbi:MAG: histone deacetylase [Promethearchaeota archaeon]
MARLPTLVLYHPAMAQEGYPVLAGRVQQAFDYLEETGTLQAPQVKLEEAQLVEDSLLQQVHTNRHIASVGGTSYDFASRLSAGASVRAGEAVWTGDAANAFVFTGCAGHHASRGSAWGFCYYNNTALLVRHLQEVHGVERFFVVDTDPHFGDGTRDILGEEPGVFHLNFYAAFGEGEEFKSPRHVDVPFPSNCGDASFVEALRRLAKPLAKESRAQMLLWNMGHDAHAIDYGGFQLSLHAFPAMTEILFKVAEDVCQGRFVVLLSGGSEVYVARHTISSIIRCLAALTPLPADTAEEPAYDSPDTERTAQKLVDNILEKLALDT